MTSITISTLTSSHTDKKNGTKRLNQLWEDVEKKQQRNQRYQQKVNDFYDYFKHNVEEQEQAVCLAAEKWVHHLLSFIPRKSIKNAQREALYDWIQEELTIIESNPFNPVKTDELRLKFNQALIDAAEDDPCTDEISIEQLDQFRQELSAMLGEDLFFLDDEELMEMVREPSKFQSFITEFLQNREDQSRFEEDDEIDWEEDAFFQDDFEGFHYQERGQTASDDVAQVTALFNDKEMTKLYRQLAKQLHPDREHDPDKKAQKLLLMQQLSQAKKNKDPLGLLLLAQQYLPEHKLALDNGKIKQLELALKGKITQLNAEHQELKAGHDLKSIIWRRFGGGSKASREKYLNQYRYGLQDSAEELLEKCREIKTVKALQQHLRERVNDARNKQALFDLGFIDLFDE